MDKGKRSQNEIALNDHPFYVGYLQHGLGTARRWSHTGKIVGQTWDAGINPMACRPFL
jgi:hypothetical protein